MSAAVIPGLAKREPGTHDRVTRVALERLSRMHAVDLALAKREPDPKGRAAGVETDDRVTGVPLDRGFRARLFDPPRNDSVGACS
jgi:hypothetical protein